MDGHIIETPLQTLGIFVPLIFYKPSIELLYAFFVVLLRGYMRHDNRCSWLIGNHHLLHHKHGNYNFGEYWLDQLFGTCYPNKKEYVYGLLYV
jgi:sterol desaturase/sphingolipid hydroxylase (fatty acid hydroxylase superfamily)